MSQAGKFTSGVFPPGSVVQDLTGNTGGPVGPDGANNINIIGSGALSVAGNPGTNTLTISQSGSVATIYDADAGTAIPAFGILNISGGNNIHTSGSGNTITVSVSDTTQHAVQIGNGTNSLTSLAIGTTGQVLTGQTGADPIWASAAASSITITGDSGGGLTGNSFTFTGGTTGLTFSGSGTTETLTGTLIVGNGGTGRATLTNHGVLVGAGTSAITQLTVGTDGQVLVGSSASDPVFATLTSSSLTYTPGPGSLAINITAPVSIANGGTNATSMTTTDGVVYFDGTRLVTTAVGSATQVLTSNGAGVAPTFQPASGGSSFTWTVVTGTSQSAAINNGYIANNAGLVTVTLPSTAAVGSIVRVSGMNNTTGWKIAQNSGQTMHFGNVNTTTGTGGSLASSATYDSVELVCNIANTDWIVISSVGNITYV